MKSSGASRLPLLLPLLLAATLHGPAQAQASLTRGTLPTEVEAALRRAQVPREALAVWVQEVGAPAEAPPRLSWQADKPVQPASLQKLFTTTAALELLGPAWSWSTPVWLQGTVQPNGVLDGNLVIKGTGDPKLVVERMWLLLRRVQQLGVREIRGDIVFDRSAFAADPNQPPEPVTDPADFDGEPLRPYNALPDALLLNFKAVMYTFTPDPTRGVAVVSSEPPLHGVKVDATVPLLAGGTCGDWRTALKADLASDPARLKFQGGYAAACGERQWGVAYVDPGSYNERALTGLWREMGGKLGGRAREGLAPAGTPPTFELRSPPLAEVVRDINKYSNNVMAQQLFLTLGLTQRGSGTPQAAREVMRQWLAERHGRTAAASASIENGSGLSRESRVSAALMGQLLQSTWGSPVMPELMNSLPVSGQDGTLRRARGASSGRAHLKTGSMRNVAGLAGYVLGQSGRRYVVVAVLNHPNAAAARGALDATVQWAVNDPSTGHAP